MKYRYLIILILMLMSCKTAEQHAKKAVEKGYTWPEKVVTKTVDKIVTIKGKDTTITVEVEIPCPNPEPLKPRWKYRFDNRRFKDSLRQMRKLQADSFYYEINILRLQNKRLRDSLKRVKPIERQREKTKRMQSRQENKRSLWWLWLIIGFLARWLLIKAYKKLKP